MPDMIPVQIDSLRVSLTGPARVIILREQDGNRFLPIWIGPYEAESITIALQEIEVSRPQTHDLIKSIIAALRGRLASIEISSLREDVFFADLVIETDNETLRVDARPSDAIAMAVRYQAPIFVSADVLREAAFEPDVDIRLGMPAPEETDNAPAPERPEDSARLSVFEDFLGNLDLDDGDQPLPDMPDTPDDPDAPPQP